MSTPLVDQVRAALEAVRAHKGKKIVRFCGRSATREYQVEAIAYDLGITPEDWALIAGLQSTPEAGIASESNPHETSLLLAPGADWCRPDGLRSVLVEGGSKPFWCVPGDFELYLEPGIDELEGKVRELLVGAFREPAEGDPERLPGIFLTPDRLDAYRQHVELAFLDLAKQIGIDLEVGQSDKQLPRGESWLAERADSDAKREELEAKLADLEGQLTAASARIAELEVKPTTEPEPELPSVEPELSSAEPVVADPPKTGKGK